MKLQNIKNKKIIDVPVEHYEAVLKSQGVYVPYVEPKRRGRPPKKKDD